MLRLFLVLAAFLMMSASPAVAKKRKRPAMTNEGIHAFVTQVLGEDEAEDARRAPGQWEFELESYQVMIVTDEKADRMRIMVPVVPEAELPDGLARRMLQANFDAVLDARYAIARGVVWSTFIHPLGPLTEGQLSSGLAQSVTAAATFGTSFHSGAFMFGGGDTSSIYTELYEKILERTQIEREGI